MKPKPSKKRAAPAASMPKQAKRTKVSKAGKSVEPAQTTDVDITAQNAVNSPLLRLPAEIRNKIWGYCYGGMMIAVHKHPSVSSDKVVSLKDIQFFLYTCVPSDQARRSLENRETVDLVAEGLNSIGDKPKLVCKQFWFETFQIFFATATFHFNRPVIFRTLAILSPMWLRNVRRLRIQCIMFSWLKRWADCFSYSLVERFTNVEGIEIRLEASRMDVESLQFNVMTGKKWERAKLPSIIRSFQQHKLKPELTRFICEPYSVKTYGYKRQGQPFANAIDEAVRTELLKHHARRRSRRGKPDLMDSI